MIWKGTISYQSTPIKGSDHNTLRGCCGYGRITPFFYGNMITALLCCGNEGISPIVSWEWEDFPLYLWNKRISP